MSDATDCRSPVGETVGMLDAAIHVLRAASRGDLTSPEAVEALLDFAGDPEVESVLSAADTAGRQRQEQQAADARADAFQRRSEERAWRRRANRRTKDAAAVDASHT